MDKEGVEQLFTIQLTPGDFCIDIPLAGASMYMPKISALLEEERVTTALLNGKRVVPYDAEQCPQMTATALQTVADWVIYHIDNPIVPDTEEQIKEKEVNNLNARDKDVFCKLEMQVICDLISIANYMDIPLLVAALIKALCIAYIKGKTPDELRATFKITRDLTAEEEEQIKKDLE